MAAVAFSSSLALFPRQKQLIIPGRCVFSGFCPDKLLKSTAFKKTLRTRESFSVSAFGGRMGGIFCCKVNENKASLEEPLEFTVRQIHYHRKDNVYENWGIHAWGDINVQTLWEEPLTATGADDFGVYWDIGVKPGGVLNFIIHKGETKDLSGSILAEDTDIWVISECSSVFKVKPDLTSVLKVAETRFASHIIVLRRLVQVKDALQGMVISNNWGVWKQKNTERANKIKERLLADSWWERVGYLLKITEPIMSMLRYADMDRPCLGEIYDGIDSMIEKIKQVINEQEQDPQETFFKQVQKIINERWNKMTTPLHLLAYALTPKYYSSQYCDLPGRLPPYRDMEVSDGYQAAFRRIFPDDDIRDVIMDEFIAFVNATDLSNDALRHRFKKHAHGWWYLHGQKFRTLQPLAIKVISQGNLSMSRAYWVSEHLLAWNLDEEQVQFQLFASKNAELNITSEGVKGEDWVIQLEREFGSLPREVIGKFPHIAHYKALKLPAGVNVKELVKSQSAIACIYANGTLMDATSIQLQGVLDDLFSYDGPLGATFAEDAVIVHLWAPTAQCVRLFIYSSPSGGSSIETIQLKEDNGVWSTHGPRNWEGKYYLYEVTVFHPSSQRVEVCMVNDPYSRGLSANGGRSLFVNLQDPLLKPEGWESLADEKPQLESFADIVIYELHIRDFSVNDKSVNPSLRGTYLGFTSHDSAGMCHLKKLAESGLTHLHLLPSFQFATVDDNKENWKFIDEDTLALLAPDSEEQQAQVVSIQNEDGYNWGYDPVLWGVPKGSYATDPNGSCRTLEFRKMVQALNRIGLRVVLDTVYNHLHSSGPNDKGSVLDKVVPGYYLRRSVDGYIENSACANNTASEHYMVNRLIIDDLLLWATEYKVDGFRFDLMGHLMKSTMVSARNTLDSLLRHEHGVDGSKLYIYGEGWDFGEVANNGRGINASQLNLAGTGIGSFNDRIRDSVIGGSPFGPHLQQGFVTGLSLQPNDHNHGGKDAVAKYLASQVDCISVGLAGNLREFVTINYEGIEVKGSEVKKDDGMPVGYALSPIETINYVSAHDNETLFDMVMWKTAKEVQLEERCRINHLATSIIALSQGIPFFHAGEDMLRSKSLDRDSYNSGDWFNRLDFSYESNNWGVGLPPKEKNGYNWPVMKTFLANPSFRPAKHHILAAVEHFQNMLKIRRSSPLFRLGTANSIQARVRFHNTGPSWVPGSIIMSIEDGNEGMPGLAQLDSLYRRIVVVFNARPSNLEVSICALKALSLSLHPVQEASSDARVKTSLYDKITGTFNIPPRTTSVFVEVR